MYTMIASAIFCNIFSLLLVFTSASFTKDFLYSAAGDRPVFVDAYAPWVSYGVYQLARLYPDFGGRPLPGRPDRGRRDMLHKTQVSQVSHRGPTSLFTARPRRPNYLPTSCRAAPAAVAQAPGIELAGVPVLHPVGAPPSALAHSDAHCATVRGPTHTPKSAWSG